MTVLSECLMFTEQEKKNDSAQSEKEKERTIDMGWSEI